MAHNQKEPILWNADNGPENKSFKSFLRVSLVKLMSVNSAKNIRYLKHNITNGEISSYKPAIKPLTAKKQSQKEQHLETKVKQLKNIIGDLTIELKTSTSYAAPTFWSNQAAWLRAPCYDSNPLRMNHPLWGYRTLSLS